MARRAGAPLFTPLAAISKARRVSSALRVNAATKIAFLSGKSRKRYGCETPARLALVTGASSGIGKGTALALVAAGFDVAGTSRVAAENPVLAQRAAVVERLGEREDLGADGARLGRVRAENLFEQGPKLSAVPMREAAGLSRDRTPHGWGSSQQARWNQLPAVGR